MRPCFCLDLHLWAFRLEEVPVRYLDSGISFTRKQHDCVRVKSSCQYITGDTGPWSETLQWHIRYNTQCEEGVDDGRELQQSEFNTCSSFCWWCLWWISTKTQLCVSLLQISQKTLNVDHLRLIILFVIAVEIISEKSIFSTYMKLLKPVHIIWPLKQRLCFHLQHCA